jgi:4,5-dihydroxyphthalate decarboxylase
MILFGGDYEHTLEVPSACRGLDLEYRIAGRPELFAKVLHQQPFDACEFSLSNYIMMRDRGEDWLTAVPVFPARAFRHGIVLVRRDDRIEAVAELAGRRVGIPEYTMTAGVWCRGLLSDEYGLHWSQLRWHASPTVRFPPPSAVTVDALSGDIEDALANAEIDALMLPTSRDALLPESARRFRPLIKNCREAEASYFSRTGIFPISHVVVVARKAMDANPALPKALVAAYGHAMERAKNRRLGVTLLPWGNDNWSQTMEIFGHDPLPYGLGAGNRAVIDKLQDYLLEQGLISRRQAITDLFVGESEAPASVS